MREDFYRVHSEGSGAGWCHCVAWWVPSWDGWGERTAIQNKSPRDALFERGDRDGYLMYADGDLVAWLQCGPRDGWPKLSAQYGLEPDPEVWAITCFQLVPELRGRGLGHRLLEHVLEDLRARGVVRVRGFPRRGEDLDPGAVWTGPEAVYRRAGFFLERDDPERPVSAKSLE